MAPGLRRRRRLSFVVIGGGPTGVELTGAIVELATFVLARDFRAIRPDQTRVVPVEAGARAGVVRARSVRVGAGQSGAKGHRSMTRAFS